MLLILNPNSEELIYGAVYFITSAPQIPFYILTMMAVSSKNQKDSNFTYRLVNSINFTQIAQSVGHLITSLILIFPQLWNPSNVIFRIVGCSMIAFYQGELPIMAILAICRILLFKNLIGTGKLPAFAKIFFSLGLCYLTFFFTVGVLTSNWIFTSPGWSFDLSVPYTDIFAFIVFYTCLLCMFISYICYIIIAFMIYVRKKNSMSVSSRKDEMAILGQYTLITIYTTVALFFWNKASDWLGFDMSSLSVRAALNIGWISGIYVNPVLLLLLNKPVRLEFIRISGFSKRNPISVQTVQSTTSKSEALF